MKLVIAMREIVMGDELQTALMETPAKRKVDIQRFYYKHEGVASKHTSLSVDPLLVELLTIYLGSFEKVKIWIKAQGKKVCQNPEYYDSKSISRAIQENIIKIIADPKLIEGLGEEVKVSVDQERLRAHVLATESKKSKKQKIQKGSEKGALRL